MIAIIVLGLVFWALFWGGICAAIWRAKGGDALTGFGGGFVFGIFGAVYFAFATPKPAVEWTGTRLPYEAGPIDWLPRWRDRRVGPLGLGVAAACVVAIALMLLLAPTPPH